MRLSALDIRAVTLLFCVFVARYDKLLPEGPLPFCQNARAFILFINHAMRPENCSGACD